MALLTGSGTTHGSAYIGAPFQVAGGAGEGEPSFYFRSGENPYQDMNRNVLAEMLLSLLLQVTNPGMTTREELMIRGNRVAPGVSEENLRSPYVSPLAIRRVV